MKKLIGGSIAIILGLFCFSVFFPAFLTFLAGIIPIILILAGCLTIYLNHENESPEAEVVETKSVEMESADLIEDITNKPIDGTPNLLGNTGTLVFHSPDCKFSNSKKCTAGFDTREEAIKKNYKPCGICKP
ncbi:MAG: hypothetical protein K8S13_20270 [Desulfobacula sp.]|uniref:Ada metal-binding domain-containing protein n=1 Tax=Desulfobacula sp. TaxID=2593537 RepID=UPI0025B8CDED|nr:Ada metal-binding domain-containing protein [Desulfobacula sp.]MCD4722173.1 hypothetical protein [Desulfobacula sp.]